MSNSNRKYTVDTITFEQLNNQNPTVPKFQRGLVWSEKAKQEFIKTIHEGFPFGSILLYKTDKLNDIYSIVDGLQRYTTIKSFSEEPGKYWDEDDKQEYRDKFEEFLELGKESDLSDSERKDSRSVFNNLVRDPHRVDSSYRFVKDIDWIDEIVKGNLDGYQEYVAELDAAIKNYIDAKNITIPVIYFEGNAEDLSIVFENLNKSGSKLTKYQIFSASWHGNNFKIGEGKLGDKVVNILAERYERLTSNKGRGLEIDGFDSSQFKEERKINLAEFAYALGKIVIDNTPSLYWSYVDNDDKIDSIGFYTLAIASQVDNRDLQVINDKFNLISDTHLKILDRVDNISKELDKIFKDKLSKRGTVRGNTKEYENDINTDLKFLSYIGSLYTYYEDEKKYRKILKNIFGYFIFDGIDSTWQNAGDSRLAEYYEHSGSLPSRDYLDPYTKSQAKKVYEMFVDNGTEDGSINFSGVIKSLVTIHFNLTYGSAGSSLNDGDDFDFEHVISAQKLKKIQQKNDPAYKQGKIPGGFIGNAMYLEQSHNREKQSNNLYQDADKLDSNSHDLSMKIISDQNLINMICYPSREDIERAEKSIDTQEYKFVIDLIKQRSLDMFEAIVESIL